MKQWPATLSVSFILLVGLSFGECCGATSDSSRKADFYVSADGADDGSGSLPESNAQGTDGPFASLDRARRGGRMSAIMMATEPEAHETEGTGRRFRRQAHSPGHILLQFLHNTIEPHDNRC